MTKFLQRAPNHRLDHDLVLFRYQKGQSRASLATEFSCTTAAISYILKKSGCVLHDVFSPDIEGICVDYLSGMSQVDLHKKYGHGRPFLAKVLGERGLLRCLPTHEEVVSAYKNSVCQSTAGLKLGVERSFVLKVLKETKTPLHDPPRKYPINHRFFENVDTEEKAYWWGFLLADGCVSGSHVLLALARTDEGHIFKFRDAVGSTAPVTHQENSPNNFSGGKGSARIGLGSRQMVTDLALLGVTPRKTFCTRVDRNLLSPELERHFWRGMIDGDGCLSWDKTGRGRPVLSLAGTWEVCNSFREWVLEVSGRDHSVRPHSNIFVIKIGANETYQTVVNLLYGDCSVSLDRKQARFGLYNERLEDMGKIRCEE